jgi:hypothetical protein
LFPAKIHRIVYIAGLCALAFGMMVGTVPTSVPQILLMANWLLEWDMKRKLSVLARNRFFWILSSVFLIHLAGVAWSEDLAAAGNDVRTKMPLMFLPMLLISSRAPDLKSLRLIMWCFVAGCLVNVTWCFLYSYVLHPVNEIRNVSRFMSHIRLGLYLDMAVAVCMWFAWRGEDKRERWSGVIAGTLLLLSVFLLGLATGIAFLFVLLGAFLVVLSVRASGRARWLFAGVLVIAVLLAGMMFLHVSREQLSKKDSVVNRVASLSPGGNPYFQFDTVGQKENGYLVLMNIQIWELQRVWNREFPADSFNDRGHNQSRYEVLVRYMSSKGLMKDSAGYAALTESDKRNIRNNVTNHLYPGWSRMRKRVYELVNEFDELWHSRKTSGHSVSMRIWFWKAAMINIAKRPLSGAGTGDVQHVLNETYVSENMPLEEDWFKRPHNQFLTVGVALGVPAMLWFIITVFYPAVTLRRRLHVLYWPFLILAVGSFFFEDTLETQAGLTFYAFFNSLLLSLSLRDASNISEGVLWTNLEHETPNITNTT